MIGAFGGLALLGAALTVIIAVRGFADSPFAVSAIAGAIGAFVSMMMRMTSGRLVLRSESLRSPTRVLGAMRPLIGAMFGATVYILLGSGLIAFDLGTPIEESFYAAALGFLAGFAERFAQDTIVADPDAAMRREPGVGSLSRVVGRALATTWRRAPKREVVELVSRVVSSSVDAALAGPTLLKWTGFVRVEIRGEHAPVPGDDAVTMQPGAHGELVVTFATESSASAWERAIDIRDGEEAKEVPFRIVPTTDRLRFESRGVELVARKKGEATATIAFTCPSENGRYGLWVQIRQRNRTIQIVPASVIVEGGASEPGDAEREAVGD